MTDLLEQVEIERQAELEKEKADGMIFLKEMKEDDLERSRSHLQHSDKKAERCKRNAEDIPHDARIDERSE